MAIDSPLRMLGIPGSPYSRKLRAVLRYRRIPYAWVSQHSPESAGWPAPKVQLLPQLVLPAADGTLEARVDSTPIIRELEARAAGRSVIPADPVVAFLDTLLEDYADEWATKMMFHYRWAFAPDVAHAAKLLPAWVRGNVPDEQIAALGEEIAKRQVERLWVVGSNETTAPTIESSYRRLLALLDARLKESRFVFGDRPAVSDFALFGQLTQLVGVDPTPMAVARETACRVIAWVDVVEDLSGIEPTDDDWVTRDRLPASVRALFAEVGRVYVPFLLANAAALERGAERVECTIDGRPWVQKPFPYQGKCLRWLRDAHARLGADDRQAVDALLDGTGCQALFASRTETERKAAR